MTEHWTASRISPISHNTTPVPIVAIRLATGRTDAVIIPTDISLCAGDNATYVWSIVRNPTITGGAWVTHTDSGGNVEYNTTATAVSGGTVIRDGFYVSTSQSRGFINGSEDPNFSNQIGRSISGASDIVCITARTITGNGSTSGSISWTDIV